MNRPGSPAQRQFLQDKLPLDRDQTVALIETYLLPLLRRAGCDVKVYKTPGMRTLTVKLPKR